MTPTPEFVVGIDPGKGIILCGNYLRSNFNLKNLRNADRVIEKVCGNENYGSRELCSDTSVSHLTLHNKPLQDSGP